MVHASGGCPNLKAKRLITAYGLKALSSLIKVFQMPWWKQSAPEEVLSGMKLKPMQSFSVVSSLLDEIGFCGSEWDIALMIACSWMFSEIESMSNSPLRICWEYLLNSKGPRYSAIGPLTKGVPDA